MCRHLGWLGRPRSLASLVLEPEHSLLVQSYAPARQKRGTMNADGWGVGFYAADEPEPRRWRSARPLWSDPSFHSVAPVLCSGTFVAAVRSATVGMPGDETAAAPFTDGTRLVSHNGRIDPGVLRHDVRAESVCDSALFAAWLLTDADTVAWGDWPTHIARAVHTIAERDPGASLNLVVAEPDRIVATTWADPGCYRTDEAGTVFSSEPLDSGPGWVEVPDRRLVEITADGVRVSALDDSDPDDNGGKARD